VEHSVMIVLRASGWRAASCSPLKPPHDLPIIATEPLDHAWFSIHEMISRASSCSCFGYSSSIIPSESPVPLMSTRIEVYPHPAKYLCLISSLRAVNSSFLYGRYSRIAPFVFLSIFLGCHNLADTFTPSAISIHVCSVVSTS